MADDLDTKDGMRRILATALDALANEYNRAVRKAAREAQELQGAQFSSLDFIAGAAAIYNLLPREDDLISWPVDGWMASLADGSFVEADEAE